MQDYSKTMQEYMRANGLSQTALAKKAGVSQATVCRILANDPRRHGQARQKLLDYVKANSFGGITLPEGDAQLKVMAAFNQVWDNTLAHAEAIARVIQSLSGLEPKEQQKRR